MTDDMLHRVYELMKWGPTSANGNPARFVFLRSREAKDRLRPILAPGNVGKTMTAPVTVIIAYDLLFYEKFPKLFPTIPQCAASLYGDPTKLYPRAPRLEFSEVCTLL